MLTKDGGKEKKLMEQLDCFLKLMCR